MGTIAELYNALKTVNINVIAKTAMGKTTKNLVDLQKAQLLKGLRQDGTSQKNYSKRSQTMFGKPNIPMQMKDTGAYHKSITVDVGTDEFEMLATDSKSEMLEDKYGGRSTLLGLTDQSTEFYTEKNFQPEFNKLISEKTGLEFN